MNIRLRTQIARPQRLRASIFARIAALCAFVLASSTASGQRGDMNCDGAVNVADIPLFVDALLATGSFSGCDIQRADMNVDTLINGLDTQPFVAALLAPCPPGLTLCGGDCVDLYWSSSNCGACGIVCPEHTACAWGTCEGICIDCGG